MTREKFVSFVPGIAIKNFVSLRAFKSFEKSIFQLYSNVTPVFLNDLKIYPFFLDFFGPFGNLKTIH